MKISKERIKQLIKEEMEDLKAEGYGDKSWHYKEPRAKKPMAGLTSNPEQEFRNKVRQMFLDLTNPIVGQGDPAPSEERINQIVNLHTKDMQPEKIKAAVEMIQSLADTRSSEVQADLMAPFQATVEKLKSAVLQKTQPFPEVPPKIAESKIKITFGKK